LFVGTNDYDKKLRPNIVYEIILNYGLSTLLYTKEIELY